jgi:predicted Zn-dependent protease
MKTIAILVAGLFLAGCASSTKPGAVGVNRQQSLWIPAAAVNDAAAKSYLEMAVAAKARGALITQGPEYERIKGIAMRVKDHVPAFREDAAGWHWQFALIDSAELNAACAPGGKIIFYTGLARRLALTDDEIAIVIAHEDAHALREHGRERVSQAAAKGVAVQIASIAAPGAAAAIGLADKGADLMWTLPNSRQNETEADTIGLELAARAGYNPHAAITLWQKMEQASKANSRPEFLSTHPANATRIADLTAMIPTVMPLYEAARRRR